MRVTLLQAVPVSDDGITIRHIAAGDGDVPDDLVDGLRAAGYIAANEDDAASSGEKASLVAEAEALGIAVDGRWGVSRLQAEIEAKKAAQAGAGA